MSHSALCCIRLNVVQLNVVWLNVVRLNVVRLNVVRVNVIRHIVGVTWQGYLLIKTTDKFICWSKPLSSSSADKKRLLSSSADFNSCQAHLLLINTAAKFICNTVSFHKCLLIHKIYKRVCMAIFSIKNTNTVFLLHVVFQLFSFPRPGYQWMDTRGYWNIQKTHILFTRNQYT